jgi:hypothetical protein
MLKVKCADLIGEDYMKLIENNLISPQIVSQQVKELYADSYIKNRKGVFEYILGGFNRHKTIGNSGF